MSHTVTHHALASLSSGFEFTRDCRLKLGNGVCLVADDGLKEFHQPVRCRLALTPPNRTIAGLIGMDLRQQSLSGGHDPVEHGIEGWPARDETGFVFAVVESGRVLVNSSRESRYRCRLLFASLCFSSGVVSVVVGIDDAASEFLVLNVMDRGELDQ